MASWTDIPNSSLETGAPARSVDALAFRDNPIAIAEGAVGAPKVQTAGINDLAVKTEKLNNLAVTTAKLNNGAVTAAKLNADLIGANKIGSIVLAHERLSNNTRYNTGTRTVAGSSLYAAGSYDEDYAHYYIDATYSGFSNRGTSQNINGWSEPLGLSGTWINMQDMQNNQVFVSYSTYWIYRPTLWRRIA